MAKPPRRPPRPAAVPARSPGVAVVSPLSATQRDHSAHAEALALFEQAMRMLQQHNYAKAAELFGHLTTIHPGERELIERSRLFLAICFRQLSPLTSEPHGQSRTLVCRHLGPECRQPRGGSLLPRPYPYG